MSQKEREHQKQAKHNATVRGLRFHNFRNLRCLRDLMWEEDLAKAGKK